MNEDQPQGNPWIKNLLVYGGIFLALLLVVSMFSQRTDATGTVIPYSDFRNHVLAGDVREVQIGNDLISGTLKSDQQFKTVPVPGDVELPKMLQDLSLIHI